MKKTKEQILEALEGLKEFEFVWTNEVTYSKTIKAKSEAEAKQMFWDGKIIPKDKDITGSDVVDNSLEIWGEE